MTGGDFVEIGTVKAFYRSTFVFQQFFFFFFIASKEMWPCQWITCWTMNQSGDSGQELSSCWFQCYMLRDFFPPKQSLKQYSYGILNSGFEASVSLCHHYSALFCSWNDFTPVFWTLQLSNLNITPLTGVLHLGPILPSCSLPWKKGLTKPKCCGAKGLCPADT